MEEIAIAADAQSCPPVLKLWGTEIYLVHTPFYSAKLLLVKPGFQCSLHRHLVKDETFLVRGGTILLEFGEKKRYLAVGDSERILPGTWHRFTNRGPARAVLLEVSTCHSDEDVERQEPSRSVITAAGEKRSSLT